MNKWLAKLETVEFATAGKPDAVPTTEAFRILKEAVQEECARRLTETDRLLAAHSFCDENKADLRNHIKRLEAELAARRLAKGEW